MSQHLGTDVAFDAGELAVGTSGDLVAVTGAACVAADLVRRLATMRGAYWLDPQFGLPWQAWLQGEMDAVGLRALQVAIAREVEKDPRVVTGSSRATAAPTGFGTVRIDVRCALVGGGNDLNLVVGFNLATLTAEVLRA